MQAASRHVTHGAGCRLLKNAKCQCLPCQDSQKCYLRFVSSTCDSWSKFSLYVEPSILYTCIRRLKFPPQMRVRPLWIFYLFGIWDIPLTHLLIASGSRWDGNDDAVYPSPDPSSGVRIITQCAFPPSFRMPDWLFIYIRLLLVNLRGEDLHFVKSPNIRKKCKPLFDIRRLACLLWYWRFLTVWVFVRSFD